MDFLLRHPILAVVCPRDAWATRKAMKEYAKAHPVCEWDGRTTPIEVHHIVPIAANPDLAADPKNMISLGARRNHLVIGHAGNWKQSVRNVREICSGSVIVKSDVEENTFLGLPKTSRKWKLFGRVFNKRSSK